MMTRLMFRVPCSPRYTALKTVVVCVTLPIGFNASSYAVIVYVVGPGAANNPTRFTGVEKSIWRFDGETISFKTVKPDASGKFEK